MKLTVLDLFSGIGGAALGFERASPDFIHGAFCEVNPDRRADLARLFPGVKVYDDVTTLCAERLTADGIFPDVICGGFPCQDISVAGKGTGIGTEENPTARSGLWFEFARIIAETLPEWIVIENSPVLRRRGLGTILRFLDARGYDAVWDGVPACAVGAYHERDRLFVIANRYRDDGGQGRPGRPDTGDTGQRQPIGPLQIADRHSARLAFWQGFRRDLGEELAAIERSHMRHGPQGQDQPGMAGTAYDVPPTLDGAGRINQPDRATWKSRVAGCGNALLPPIMEAIGRAIVRSNRKTVDNINVLE